MEKNLKKIDIYRCVTASLFAVHLKLTLYINYTSTKNNPPPKKVWEPLYPGTTVVLSISHLPVHPLEHCVEWDSEVLSDLTGECAVIDW